MHPDHYIYAIWTFSFVSNLYIMYHLSMEIHAPSTLSLYYLISSQLLLMLTNIPDIYDMNMEFCEFVAFVHSYAQVSEVIAAASISYFTYHLLTAKQFNNSRLSFYLRILIWVTPLVTVLPYSTDSFGESDDRFFSWCNLSNSVNGNKWSFAVIYTPAFICIITMFYYYFLSFLKLYSSNNFSILQKFIILYGLYPLVMIILWGPRFIKRISNGDTTSVSNTKLYAISNLTTMVAGIAFSLLFYFQRADLLAYEDISKQHNDVYVSEYEAEDPTSVSTQINHLPSSSSSTDPSSVDQRDTNNSVTSTVSSPFMSFFNPHSKGVPSHSNESDSKFPSTQPQQPQLPSSRKPTSLSMVSDPSSTPAQSPPSSSFLSSLFNSLSLPPSTSSSQQQQQLPPHSHQNNQQQKQHPKQNKDFELRPSDLSNESGVGGGGQSSNQTRLANRNSRKLSPTLTSSTSTPSPLPVDLESGGELDPEEERRSDSFFGFRLSYSRSQSEILNKIQDELYDFELGPPSNVKSPGKKPVLDPFQSRDSLYASPPTTTTISPASQTPFSSSVSTPIPSQLPEPRSRRLSDRMLSIVGLNLPPSGAEIHNKQQQSAKSFGVDSIQEGSTTPPSTSLPPPPSPSSSNQMESSQRSPSPIPALDPVYLSEEDLAEGEPATINPMTTTTTASLSHSSMDFDQLIQSFQSHFGDGAGDDEEEEEVEGNEK